MCELLKMAVVIGVLLVSGPAWAQEAAATLSGVVLDETGAAIDSVEVIAANSATGLQRSVRTNADGAFVMPLLPAGQYIVTAQREGFAATELEDVLLKADDVTRVRIQLKVAALSEAVVVTAQKRGDERLQDVPVPVSVLDAQTLASSSQLLLRDYYQAVPGLSLAPNYLARQQLAIRGMMPGGSTSPTVGVVIDDIPYGASTDAMGGAYIPDIDPGDLARIEVLRGPQGTLYGANTMGGLIKYVTVDPSFAGYSGRLEFGTNGVYNGDEPGYNFRGSVNLPLSDRWALRASGFTRRDAGYIDNPFRRIDGVNRAVGSGGRLAALWQPSPKVSLKLSAMYQHNRSDGASEILVLPGLGDLQQDYLPDTRGYGKTVQAYTALLKTTLAGVDVTSITGYNVNDHTVTDDRGYAFGAAVQALYGVNGVRYHLHSITKKITQEIRASSRIGRRWEWLAGAFYTHEQGPTSTTMKAEDAATGRSAGGELFYDYIAMRRFDEYSAFGNLTYHVTDRFNVQVGGRESHNRLVVPYEITSGTYPPAVLGQPSPLVQPFTQSESRAFTYLVTPQMKFTPDVMGYARFASGYRPGGPNQLNAVLGGAPPQVKPDRTQTYEVGVKGSFLGHRVSADLSLYYIDWTDIQIGLRIPTAVYAANGGGAKSQGAELSMAYMPTRRLTISGWAVYNDAELTKPFPAESTAYGVAGMQLPFASRGSGNLAVQQEFPLWRGAIGSVGGTVSYVGDRMGIFQATALRQDLPAYTRTDLHAGVRYNAWSTNLFVNNVADTRGLINGGLGYVPSNAFAYIQPRSFGISVARSF